MYLNNTIITNKKCYDIYFALPFKLIIKINRNKDFQ